MAGQPSSDQQFTEKEVAAILKRAGEVQAATAADGVTRPESGGTSLTQLQQAAAEIGIDPQLIEQAASELVMEQGAGPGSPLLGGPWGVDYDRLIPGTVDENNWPMIVDEMRAATGRVGTPKTVGKAFEWLSNDPDPLHISFTPHGENTRVRITARFGQWGGLLYIFPSFFALLAATIVSTAMGTSGAITPELVAAMLLGAPSITIAGARVVFGRICVRKRAATRRLIARLEEAIRKPAQITAEQVQIGPRSYAPVDEELPQRTLR